MANDKQAVLTEYEQIEDMHSRVKEREEKWLRSKGWTYTSSTPDYCWRWEKEWNGRTILVDRDTALTFQQRWDERES
jgi:hypothetical protein